MTNRGKITYDKTYAGREIYFIPVVLIYHTEIMFREATKGDEACLCLLNRLCGWKSRFLRVGGYQNPFGLCHPVYAYVKTVACS